MSLKAFLSDNVEKLENKKAVISKRFKDDEGNPIEWEFRPITAKEDESLMADSFKQVQDPKTGRMRMDSDSIGYANRVTVKSIVYPNLLNAELQDSYGVTTPEELLRNMLYKGEYTKAQSVAQEVNGMNELDNLVEEAKNE